MCGIATGTCKESSFGTGPELPDSDSELPIEPLWSQSHSSTRRIFQLSSHQTSVQIQLGCLGCFKDRFVSVFIPNGKQLLKPGNVRRSQYY